MSDLAPITGLSPVVVQDTPDKERAVNVRFRLLALKRGVVEQFLEFAALIKEAKEQEYHIIYGFGDFGEWSLQELEISERQAYYMIQVINGANALGIPLDDLKKLRVSQLKEIFSLDAEQYAEQIKELVASGVDMTVEATKDKVMALKAEREGLEPMAMFTIKVPLSARAVIRQAIDKVKVIDGDMSDGRALELICGDYIGGEYWKEK